MPSPPFKHVWIWGNMSVKHVCTLKKVKVCRISGVTSKVNILCWPSWLKYLFWDLQYLNVYIFSKGKGLMIQDVPKSTSDSSNSFPKLIRILSLKANLINSFFLKMLLEGKHGTEIKASHLKSKPNQQHQYNLNNMAPIQYVYTLVHWVLYFRMSPVHLKEWHKISQKYYFKFIKIFL